MAPSGVRRGSIASDTAGKYFSLPDSCALQSVMDQVEATLTCQSAPKTFGDNLAQGKTRAHSVTLSRRARSAQLALTWTSPLDRFKVKAVKIGSGSPKVRLTTQVSQSRHR